MSNAPHKAVDKVNVFGIVLIGVASALLLWATAVALQGYYLDTSAPVEEQREAMELESVQRSIKAQQVANLHRSEENVSYEGSAEACYRQPIEAAMLSVVADAVAGKPSLVPAVGPHDQRMVAPIPGYPAKEGAAAAPAAPVLDPNAPAKVTISETNIQIDDKIQFDSGSAAIAAVSIPLVEEIAAVLLANPRIELVEIAGHTDNAGVAAANTALSKARAEAVRDYLTGRGVGAERLEAQGYGPSKPIADNRNEAGREQNRRVELVIIKQRESNDAPATEPREPTAPQPREPETPIEPTGSLP